MFKGSFCLSICSEMIRLSCSKMSRLPLGYLSIFLSFYLSICPSVYLALSSSLSPFYLSLCESLPISVSLAFFFLALALALALARSLSLSLPLPPGCLSLWSVYLSIYLLYNSARLPSKVLYPLKRIILRDFLKNSKFTAPKWRKSARRPQKYQKCKVDDIDNGAILRDFLNFWCWQRLHLSILSEVWLLNFLRS